MTFGIDIASPQRDIDLGRAKAEGVQFVVVKMGGLNVTPQYVAPYYHRQVDKAVAAGLPKGHYYLIGKGQTPEAQAVFFVNNLYRFDKDRDILALDNEALDANGTRWGDADAARFARRVLQLTGIPANRFWHYAGASDYRATGSWPELAALGVRFWWAAYGSYPTGQTPDHEPALQGSIPRWDVHQFTSASRVAGYSLDGNYSPHSIDTLFGSGSTPAGSDVEPIEATEVEGAHMRFLFTRDQGGGGTLWTLINTATGQFRQTRDQATANLWAEAWGAAHTVSVNAYLAALEAVTLTTDGV
jgi:hypothetical protein